MPARSWRDWLALLLVAMLTAVVVTALTLFAAFQIYVTVVTGPDEPSPLWSVLLLIPTMGIGVLVGGIAGLRRWWLALPAVFSVLGAFAAGAVAMKYELLPILWVVPGFAAGSLLAVALADVLGGGERRSEAPRGVGRG